MQIKQKNNGIECNVTFFTCDKKNSPRRRSMKYLTNEGSPNSVSFTVSEILDPPGFVYIYLYTYIYIYICPLFISS